MQWKTSRRGFLAAAGAGAASLAVAACGGTAGGGGGGGGSKPSLTVGSKDFTEELIVGNMLGALLQDAGYHVTMKLNLGGTVVCHQALVRGDIDTYVEYTGTGLTTILKQPSQPDPQAVYKKVKQLYESKFKLTWLKQWGFNDTYAMVMRKDRASQLKIENISDLKKNAGELTLGATQEFLARPDGLPGMSKAYGGINFKGSRGMDPGLMYQAVDQRQVDVISAFSTDGLISALKLAVLKDDKRYFPPYFAAPVVRESVLSQSSGIQTALDKLEGKISEATMSSLNLQVDQDKKDPAAVAKAFLREQSLIK
jgi:osmoprotectant transport system substrate-binding protein